LTLDKKSFSQRKLSRKVEKDSLVSLYEKTVYVFNSETGIMTVWEDNKSKDSIGEDASWGRVIGMHVYNGNIYLLDGGEGNVYKYLGTGEGFGDKTSYFKGSYDVIDETSSFAINSAVFVETQNSITQYVSGVKEEMTSSIPGSFEITKLITYIDEDRIYGWDKKNGVVYVLTKEGMYQKQIANDAFTKADDIEVYNKTAHVLSGQKIVTVSVE